MYQVPGQGQEWFQPRSLPICVMEPIYVHLHVCIRPSPRMYTSISTYVYADTTVANASVAGSYARFSFALLRRDVQTTYVDKGRACAYDTKPWVWMVPLHHGWDKTSPVTNVPWNAYSADARATPKDRGAQRARRIQASSARSRSLTVQQAHTALPAGNGGHTALHRDRR